MTFLSDVMLWSCVEVVCVLKWPSCCSTNRGLIRVVCTILPVASWHGDKSLQKTSITANLRVRFKEPEVSFPLVIMGKVIVADENQGRRTLLASTLEREGFDVTRAGTLRQAEGTALAVMPEVVLLDGEWKSGDAIDAAQRLMGDPEFAFKCRIVLLSRSTTPDFMLVAAKAGIHEVIGKPVDMKVLIDQLWKHSRKQFVPPPADVTLDTGGGSFDVAVMAGGGGWALPMLKGLVGAGPNQ